MPFRSKTISEYEAACTACEIKVELGGRTLSQVCNALRDSSFSRVLKTNFPELGLQKGDRVEPSREVPQPSQLKPGVGPIQVTFWRAKKDTLSRHHNPLLCKEAGLNLNNFVPDWLHCLSLGRFVHF